MSNLSQRIFNRPFLKRQGFQPLWERLHNWTLVWMNYGGGCSLGDSGEHHVIKLLGQTKTQKGSAPTVFDVGANIGDYSVCCKELVPPAILYCFEPLSTAYAELNRRLSTYRDVHPLNIALSDRSGSADIYSYSFEGQPAYALASLVERLPTQHGRIELEGTTEVSVSTIDAFCDANAIDVIDLLKIDVEGHELSVLKGAERKIRAGQIYMIQFEFGPANLYSHTTFFEFWSLLSPQYEIFRILPNGFRRIRYYEESCEIYLTTNYLAKLQV